jgi:DNA-binding protein HU-beta
VTKTQIINRIARNHKMTKKEAGYAVNTFCETIVSNMKRGNRVSIAGFGSFSVRKAGGFTVRNPRTGISRKVAPYKEVCFTPAPKWNPKKKTTRKNRTKK